MPVGDSKCFLKVISVFVFLARIRHDVDNADMGASSTIPAPLVMILVDPNLYAERVCPERSTRGTPNFAEQQQTEDFAQAIESARV